MAANGECLINKQHVRSYILRSVRETRQCSRVSAAVLDDLDHALRMRILGAVQRHPARGKTFCECQ